MAKLKTLGRNSSFWPDPLSGPWVLTFHWAEIDGLPECVGLDVRLFRDKGEQQEALPHAEPKPITATLMRSLPVDGLIREAASMQKALYRWSAQGSKGSNPAARAGAKEQLPIFEKSKRRRGGRRLYWTDERLAEVANVYVDALARKKRPTQAVAKAFKLSDSMAAKLVRRCREKDLLRPTKQGKAGR